MCFYKVLLEWVSCVSITDGVQLVERPTRFEWSKKNHLLCRVPCEINCELR